MHEWTHRVTVPEIMVNVSDGRAAEEGADPATTRPLTIDLAWCAIRQHRVEGDGGGGEGDGDESGEGGGGGGGGASAHTCCELRCATPYCRARARRGDGERGAALSSQR